MFDHESDAKSNSAKATAARAKSSCCAAAADPSRFEHIPQEILDHDCGCADLSSYVRPGDSVLDLGSNSGKFCYVAAKIVGAVGNVVGVDWDDAMLDLAVRNRKAVAEKLGYANVEFKKGKIQDLRLDYALVEEYLHGEPLKSLDDLQRYEAVCARLRAEKPLVADNSVTLAVSNCALNFVKQDEKSKFLAELYRALQPDGRAVISGMVSDEDVPVRLSLNPELWKAGFTGALREDRLLLALENVGFGGMTLDTREERPRKVVDGIEFRSVTVIAYKPPGIANKELNQAAIYRGPWKQVMADDGTVLRRGMRMAVGSRTYAMLSEEPYSGEVIGLDPMDPIDQQMAFPFEAQQNAVRNPKQSKCGPADHECNDHDHGHAGGKCC